MNTVTTARNKYGLRDLYVPADIMPKFLDIAKQNTAKNLETCGILAGKLVSCDSGFQFKSLLSYERSKLNTILTKFLWEGGFLQNIIKL